MPGTAAERLLIGRIARRRGATVITGRIATLQGPVGFGWVEAIAIGGGRVLAAGLAREVSALATARTRRWNLGEKAIVMPSLTDAHLHLIHAALAAEQPDLTELDLAAAAATVAQRHRDLAAAGDVDGWLLGHGWSFSALGGRPHRDLLDRCAPGRPVALWSHDHHTRWLSSAALQRAGVAPRDDPPAGRIERDDAGRGHRHPVRGRRRSRRCRRSRRRMRHGSRPPSMRTRARSRRWA